MEVRSNRLRAGFPKPVTNGNLPLGIKYKVKNSDGSISTVRTISIGVDGGEVVIPTVLKGKVVSDEEAIEHYERTGANFGKFASPKDAKMFSEWLHNKHADEMKSPSRRVAFDGSFDPLATAKELGFRPTSGLRVQAHQDDLRRRGLTKTRRGHHVEGNAYDFSVPEGMTKQEAIALARKQWPGAKVIPTNGNSIHVTYPNWGGAKDVSGSARRYGGR